MEVRFASLFGTHPVLRLLHTVISLDSMTKSRSETGISFSRRVAGGAMWAIGMRVGDRVLGILSTLVLARLLSPEDFGLVAMAMAIVGLLEAFTALGLETILISKADATRSDYDTAWTLNAGIGLALAAALILIASPAADYYKTPEVRDALYVLALLPAISGFENIGIVDFRKHLKFDKDFLFNISKKAITTTITVSLAAFLQSHWALIYGMIFGRIASVIISYTMSPFRPRPCLSNAGEIFSFSKWLLIHNLLFFLRNRISDFTLGRTHGSASVGLFNMANEIATLPSTELVMPINRAIFPSYAMVADDLPRLQSGFLRVIAAFSVISVPACVGLSLAADYAVPILLGQRWLEAVPIMEIMAFAGLTVALQSNCWAVFLALKRPKLQAYLGILQAAILLTAILILSPSYGPVGASLGYLFAGAISLPIVYIVTLRILKLRARVLVAQLWRPMVAATVMYFLVSWLKSSLSHSIDSYGSQFSALMLCIGLGVASYALSIFAIWALTGRPKGGETDLYAILRRRNA